MDWLLDTSHFITRDHCGISGGWTNQLITTYQFMNLVIAIAYFSIPASLFGLWHKMGEIKFNSWIILMFVIFIFACGLGHIMDVISFYYAPYRFFVLIDSITAIFSVVTAILLPAVIYDVLKLVKESQNEPTEK